MNDRIEEQLRRIARDRCEYCHIPERFTRLPHVLDHIIAGSMAAPTTRKTVRSVAGDATAVKRQISRGLTGKPGSWFDYFIRAKINGPPISAGKDPCWQDELRLGARP